MPERPRLIDFIDPFLRAEVSAKFPPEYLDKYEDEMHKIKRLGHNSYLPIKPGFQESDLDHTCDMLGMLRELRLKFVHLPEEINFKDVAYMIAMHDAGEIIVGDGPPFGPLRESPLWKRRKRQEPKMALKFIVGQIPDEAVQLEMSNLYHRFTQQNSNDKEALLTRLLDKAQGTTRTGPTYAFDYRAQGISQPSYKLSDHVFSSTAILIDAAKNLHATLSPESGAELAQFTVEELGRFRSAGFGRHARRRIREFTTDIQR
jgi:5'-deoxynucleotidase YfbR-like HD superfamily hydrolase